MSTIILMIALCHTAINVQTQAKKVLVAGSTTLIEWFGENKMQVNPYKFQAKMLGSKGYENCKNCKGLNLCGNEINCENLCVTFDYLLNFDLHISNKCKKVVRQIDVLFFFTKKSMFYYV